MDERPDRADVLNVTLDALCAYTTLVRQSMESRPWADYVGDDGMNRDVYLAALEKARETVETELGGL